MCHRIQIRFCLPYSSHITDGLVRLTLPSDSTVIGLVDVSWPLRISEIHAAMIATLPAAYILVRKRNINIAMFLFLCSHFQDVYITLA